jgi:hypothetical protein
MKLGNLYQAKKTRLIELLGQRVDSNPKPIAANTQSINTVAEAAGRILRDDT